MLTLCWAFGAFAVAHRITRKRLRILCYHGFSVGDQHEFSPFLFMRPEILQRHIDLITRMRIPVVSLKDGVAMLASHSVQRGELAKALFNVADFDTHDGRSLENAAADWACSRLLFHSTRLLSTSVTSASKASREATADQREANRRSRQVAG